jgi:hypothetical protein
LRVAHRVIRNFGELAPAIAGWLLDEFRHALSPSHDERVAKLLAQKASEETSVLFEGNVPVGTAAWSRTIYTWTAEPVYARLGWVRVGLERDTDRNIEVVLMKRDLR